MYKIKVNDQFNFEIENDQDALKVNGENVAMDIQQLAAGRFHFLYKHKSYTVELVSENSADKTAFVKVNGKDYQVALEDRFDLLLKQMGIDNFAAGKSAEIKAPMPGLVLNVLIVEGQEIKKGDNLIVLEAMKMENMLKSAADGIVKHVLVSQGDKVEKNQVLVTFF
ncbi:biotin/lipoyl-binding protein [Pedobacter sp. MC2016-14]|uniref:biotin/lipoyl-containing protein n=1 Tax=Pedobacter sp. MC2016-14 TaxID=2897327 RepID=UPI001E55CA7C|nr:acetyl-CoA carboxylase biotin carboxyl carrier protein subunit [Pedobacter sp. MC2016-14]MCD0487529.1 biotin/lipoyl-binding protein [Pedobacter sp. MC2016-14]